MKISTGVGCTICGSDIVAEVELVPTTPTELLVFGPGSLGCSQNRVLSFHCSAVGCAMMFYHPPGKPNMAAEILSKLAEAQSDFDFPLLDLEGIEGIDSH